MADASDIYRRFVEAPLRLKTRTPSPSPPSTPPRPTQKYDAFKPGPWGDSPAFSTRSKEVKKLRRRVAKIKLSADDAAIPIDLDRDLPAATASTTVGSAGSSSMDAGVSKLGSHKAVTQDSAPKTLLKKKKRVTRSMSTTNEEIGAEFVDTPTKPSKPSKRFRKYSRDSSRYNEGGKENYSVSPFSLDGAESGDRNHRNDAPTEAITDHSPALRRKTSVTVTLPPRRSRRLQHLKAESPKPTTATPSSQQATEASDTSLNLAATPPTNEAIEDKRILLDETTSPVAEAKLVEGPAGHTPVDPISTYCDSLLSTNTVSGCFLALSFNALRGISDSLIAAPTSSDLNPFETIFTICHGIAKCEKLAQHLVRPKIPKAKSPKSPKLPKSDVSRRRSSGKIVLKAKKIKKSVRFRSFDLSCLNLQYVEDEQVAVMVDKILIHYGTIMEHVEKMRSCFDCETDTPVQAVVREMLRVMTSPSGIYSTPQSNCDASDVSKRIYRRAFGGRDPYSQHEIRICGEYFARQFANLLLPCSSSSPLQFLQGVFSSLASSSVRFKLRVLFIESKDFGEDVSDKSVDGESRVLLDEDGKPFPAMAPYEHQDLGAAIHWALQESVLYWPLVQPLYDILRREESSKGDLDEDSPMKAFLNENGAEDLDHMEKYVLARRFLRFHLTKSWRHRLKGESDAAETWTSIEKVCSLVKRFHFEDEAHLFPLASVDQFVALLAHEESTLQRMEEVLQSFYEQKYGMSSLQPEPCMECHQLISRVENPTSIRCTSCARRFHLECLHLPESFAQYAEHYTCPMCFLGRGGY